MTSGGTVAASRRFTALDGLRGLAALVVVVDHAMMVSPTLSLSPGHPPTGAAWWFVFSPLHLLWAGTEAVMVFFVLSGFVLSLPFIERRPGWRAYYPRRLVRLYAPVLGAIVFALALFFAVPRVASPSSSAWVNGHHFGLSARTIVGDLTLASPSQLDGPLWSLKFEVIFSALLPLYVFAAVKFRRFGVVLLLGALAAAAAGAVLNSASVLFLPMFAVGVLLATNRERATRWVGAMPGWLGWVVLAAALLLLPARWSPLGHNGSALAVAAAAVLVVLFLAWGPTRDFGDRPPVQWLGKRSFSLYLVHEPIVVSLAMLLGPHPLTVLACALPLSVVACAAFYRFVEKPSHRLANRVGRLVAGRPEPGSASGSVVERPTGEVVERGVGLREL